MTYFSHKSLHILNLLTFLLLIFRFNFCVNPSLGDQAAVHKSIQLPNTKIGHAAEDSNGH